MATCWIVVADAALAKIYATTKSNGGLHLIKEFAHPDSRKKSSDLVSGSPGKYKFGNMGRGKFVSRSDPKQNEEDQFAKQIITELESGRVAHEFDTLILVAAPHFHGLLDKALNDQLRKTVEMHVQKNYLAIPERNLLTTLKPSMVLSR